MGNIQRRQREQYIDDNGFTSINAMRRAQSAQQLEIQEESSPNQSSRDSFIKNQKDFLKDEISQLAQSHWFFGLMGKLKNQYSKRQREKEHEARRAALMLEPNPILTFAKALMANFVFGSLYSSILIVMGPIIGSLVTITKALYGLIGWKYSTILAIDSSSKEALRNGVVNISIDSRIWVILAPVLSLFCWHNAFVVWHRWQMTKKLKESLYLDKLRHNHTVNQKIAKRLANAEAHELKRIEEDDVEIV